MSYVLDSSCLIYLGKIKILEKLEKAKYLIPESVYKEVVEIGLKRNEPESFYIKKLVENKFFSIKKVNKLIGSFPFLGYADIEVISLARENNSIAILDDDYAKKIAQTLGVKTRGTIYLIIKLIKNNIISKGEGIKYINEIIGHGFYLSNKKYLEILEIINSI